MDIHHTTICIGRVSNLDEATLRAQPGVSLYHFAGADVQDQIEMALLDHLHCCRTIVFVGGEEAKRQAHKYGVTWIEDSPTVNEHLLRFWRTTAPMCDSP